MKIYFKMSKEKASFVHRLTPNKLYEVIRADYYSKGTICIIKDDAGCIIHALVSTKLPCAYLNCEAHWVVHKNDRRIRKGRK